MLRSLWFRLTGTVVALVVFSLVLAFVATLVIAGREFADFIQNTSDAIIQITAPTEMVTGGQSLSIPSNQGLIQINPNVRGGIQISPDGPGGVRIDRGGVTITGGAADTPMSQINVQIPNIVRSEGTKLAANVLNSVLFVIILSGTLAIIAATWLFWQITRPLTRLRDATEQIASGQLDARVRVRSKDEVGRVGLAFNRMAGELQRQEGLRKQLVADVAHELRTPLSVMQGNLEAMVDDLLPASPEELDGLHREVLRLSRLVEDLRLLSLVDAGELQLRADRIDANELAETAVRRMAALAESRGVILGASLSPAPAMVTGDEGKLHQVLANLISNALRYTPEGKRVNVSVQANRGTVTLQVVDEGPGVDPADLPDLFERFYKGDRSRSRDKSGSGLGLSIVKQLVELHGGQVAAALPPEGGLQVTVRLPAASDLPDTRLPAEGRQAAIAGKRRAAGPRGARLPG